MYSLQKKTVAPLKFSLDDAIVVVEVEKGVCCMESAVRTLRGKLGDDAMSDLQTLLDDAGRQWKDDVLAITGERFERRLSDEISALRVDMAKEFAALRVEMATRAVSTGVGMATVGGSTNSDILKTRVEVAPLATPVRADILNRRTDILKWMFLLRFLQIAAISWLLAFLVPTGAR